MVSRLKYVSGLISPKIGRFAFGQIKWMRIRKDRNIPTNTAESAKVILKADDFVIEAEDPLANKTLRSRVCVRFVGSEFPGSHIIVSPPPVPPAICRILPG